jgi:hypothetical protein
VKWDEDMTTNRDWTSQIFGMSPRLLAFTLNGQTNTLPSPSNLRRWGFHRSTHHCILCGKLGTTAKHTLSNCPVALKGGRYKWRHDNVLRTLYPDLLGLVNATHRSPPKSRPSTHRQPFVKAGAKPYVNKTPRCRTSVLDLANDWILLVDDVPIRTIFPPCTGVDTLERPDIIIYSKSANIVIWGELTVPLEENMDAARIRKRKKYSESNPKSNVLSLADECRRNNWTVHDFTFEVGSLGWVGYSTRQFLTKLGFKSSQLKWLLNRTSRIAMRSSYLIWCCRKERSWEPPVLVPLRVTAPDPPRAPPRPITSSSCRQRCKTCRSMLCPGCLRCDPCGLCDCDDEKGKARAGDNDDDLIDPERKAARNFLATITSFNVNPGPGPGSVPRRPPPRPPPFDPNCDLDALVGETEDFDALIADAENFNHDQSPSPLDGPAD